MVRDGLKLKNVKFSAEDSKRSTFPEKSGVIIATCKCVDDTEQMLQAKGKLCEIRVQIWPGVHITKNPNFDPISTFSYFHYKKLGYPNFL